MDTFLTFLAICSGIYLVIGLFVFAFLRQGADFDSAIEPEAAIAFWRATMWPWEFYDWLAKGFQAWRDTRN